MHLFMKFILAPVLFVLSVFVIIQTYRKYKRILPQNGRTYGNSLGKRYPNRKLQSRIRVPCSLLDGWARSYKIIFQKKSKHQFQTADVCFFVFFE